MPGMIHGVATAGNNCPISGPSPNRGRVPKFPEFVGNKQKAMHTFQQTPLDPRQLRPPLRIGEGPGVRQKMHPKICSSQGLTLSQALTYILE